jgi:hypothetical protein
VLALGTLAKGELIEAAFLSVNLPYTVLTIIVMLYWCLAILGAADLNALDFDLDFDADMDMDANANMDMAGGGHGFIYFLGFFGIGAVPLTLSVTFLVLSMWSVSLLANHYLHNTSGLIALGMFLPILFCGLIMAKFLTFPIIPLFKKLREQSGQMARALGSACIISSSEATETFGQAEVTTDGAPLTLNVRTTEGETLKKGDEAVVVDYDKDASIYLVKKLSLENTP